MKRLRKDEALFSNNLLKLHSLLYIRIQFEITNVVVADARLGKQFCTFSLNLTRAPLKLLYLYQTF